MKAVHCSETSVDVTRLLRVSCRVTVQFAVTAPISRREATCIILYEVQAEGLIVAVE
jgi:hypothetical protein